MYYKFIGHKPIAMQMPVSSVQSPKAFGGKLPSRCISHQRKHNSVQVFCQRKQAHDQGHRWIQDIQKAGLAAAAALVLLAPTMVAVPSADARLIARDPIKNARAILRYALPVENEPIRNIQAQFEAISDDLRLPGKKAFGPAKGRVTRASETLSKGKSSIVAAFAPSKKADGLQNLSELEKGIQEFDKIFARPDKDEIFIEQQKVLQNVGNMIEDMIGTFPFQIPSEYDNLPQLLGRATVEVNITLRSTPTGEQTGNMIMVLDGYNAPVTAGAYVDLVQKNFYDGLPIQRADGFVVQTGDPPGPAEGYLDPKTGKERRVPLEIRAVGQKKPYYEETFDDLGRQQDIPWLPFNAYGTLAMGRLELEPNSGSSQIFWLLKESELTPSGANLLDGRFAVMGYVVEGQELLQTMKVGDTVNYMKVIDGLQNLKEPKDA